MKRIRPFAGLAALALAAGVALAGCASGGTGASPAATASDAPVTLRLALNNAAPSLPIVVAQKQGFFSAEHLTAKTTVLSDITVVPSLLGKQYDVGFTVAPILINAVAGNIPVAAIVGNDGDNPKDKDSTTQIAVRSGITKVSDLKGKRIGAPTLTGNINIATKAWLKKKGVDPSSVQFVQVATPNMLDQLKAGQVDAVELQQPFISAAEADGIEMLGDPQSALSDSDFVSDTYWAADAAWAKANPGVVDRFRTAVAKAQAWITANPAKARPLLAEFTGVTTAAVANLPLGPYKDQLEPSDLKIWGDAMKELGVLKTDVDYSKLVVTK